jgi:endoglucanase
MDDAAVEFLRKILETPSPSGYEQPVQKLVREYAATFADKVTTDTHGNVIAVKNPGATVRVMLAGHCDQIGLVVQHVDAEGYIYFQPVGGWDAIQLVGQRMTAWTATGPIGGVIGRKPIHLLTDEERKQVPKLKDLWLDIGAKDKAEVEEVVRVGDPITFQLGFQRARNNKPIRRRWTTNAGCGS